MQFEIFVNFLVVSNVRKPSCLITFLRSLLMHISILKCVENLGQQMLFVSEMQGVEGENATFSDYVICIILVHTPTNPEFYHVERVLDFYIFLLLNYLYDK